MKSFEKLKKGSNGIIPAVWIFIQGLALLLIFEAPNDLRIAFNKHWLASKTNTQKASTIIAGLIVSIFILWGLYGVFSTINNAFTKGWREEVLFQSYEQNIKNFFNKYNERFSAHDCNFMREVGADEAMFDKWQRTAYPPDSYSCEEFITYQQKFIIPITINPIEQNGDKYRATGKAIIIKINQGEPWEVEAMYYNLWKKLDFDLWHFNNPKDGPRKIQIKNS